MKIDKETFVSLSYVLSLENGQKVEETAENDPLCFVFGIGRMMPGLEKGLLGLEAGSKTRITVEPEEGYGNKSDQLIREFPRTIFSDDSQFKVGDRVRATGPQGDMIFEIKQVTEDKVTCDFNHPLAGMRLFFDVEVQEVRPSTQADIEAMNHGCGSGDCDSSECGSSSCGCAEDD
jgi:FKBP-type peptidyl-prolyl cis-trans isomerase SlyD